jgi:hypothetical protein
MARLTTGLALLFCLVAVHGQGLPTLQVGPPAPAAKPGGLITGQVVDARGDGVANAVVTLNGGLQQVALTIQVGDIPGGPRRTLTSGDGRFVFFDLPAGSYSMEASKPGFLPGAFGRRRFGGPAQSLELAEAELESQVRIPIWEYASISGRIVDEAGEPAVGW